MRVTPLSQLQARLTEVGRIRMGVRDKSGRGIKKLETWRLTSPDRQLLEQAAAIYGGVVEQWEEYPGQWQVFTESSELDIYVSPVPISQWYELWSKGGCQRRCDGIIDHISGGPCRCDKENPECKLVTRLSVWLYKLTGLGVWRLETQGQYAAHELPAQVGLLMQFSAQKVYIPATLAIEMRTQVKDGMTRHFVVPTIRTRMTLAEIAQTTNIVPRWQTPAALTNSEGVALTALPSADATSIPVNGGDVPPVDIDVQSDGAVETAAPVEAKPEPIVTKASRSETKPANGNGGDIWEGPGQCPDCYAPAGKPHATKCRRNK